MISKAFSTGRFQKKANYCNRLRYEIFHLGGYQFLRKKFFLSLKGCSFILRNPASKNKLNCPEHRDRMAQIYFCLTDDSKTVSTQTISTRRIWIQDKLLTWLSRLKLLKHKKFHIALLKYWPGFKLPLSDMANQNCLRKCPLKKYHLWCHRLKFFQRERQIV